MKRRRQNPVVGKFVWYKMRHDPGASEWYFAASRGRGQGQSTDKLREKQKAAAAATAGFWTAAA